MASTTNWASFGPGLVKPIAASASLARRSLSRMRSTYGGALPRRFLRGGVGRAVVAPGSVAEDAGGSVVIDGPAVGGNRRPGRNVLLDGTAARVAVDRLPAVLVPNRSDVS